MTKLLRAGMAIGLMAMLANRTAATLYVVQVGDGALALTTASTAVSIVKFDDAGGSPLDTIPLPTAASGSNFPFTTSGSATSEGFLALSTNGQYLTMAGYGVAPGVAAVASSTSVIAPRAAARIALADETIDTTTVFNGDTSYTGDNARSAVSNDGQQFWLAGSGEGIRYATLGGNTTTRLNTTNPDNNRVVDIFNGQLYTSSGSVGFQGPSAVGSGLPTTEMQTVTLLPGFPTSGTHSPYDYWFKDASTVYVADDGTAANGGGIQKWTSDGSAWSLAYTLLNTGTATTAVRGLTGEIDGENVVLYATTTQTSANQLIAVVDSGAAATATTLAMAPVNTAFRGVEFVGSLTPPVNNADFDNSGTVDGRDFLIWQRHYGADEQPDKSTGDATGGGTVDDADFAAWKLKFGGPPAVAAAGVVPEPATVVMGALLAVVGAWRRRRSQAS